MANRFYVALAPFDILVAVGSKPSNTFIGRSQVIDTIYEARRVMPGEEIHDLVGGTFYVDGDGEPWAARFTHPPHIFEAAYHRGDEGRRRDALLAQDYLAVEDEPRKVARYRKNAG